MNLSKEKTVSFDAHFTAEEIERILINAIEQKHPEFSTRYACSVGFQVDGGTLRGVNVEGVALQSSVDGFLNKSQSEARP